MVKADWIVIEEMDFPRLGKLSLPTVTEPTDLIQCGALEYYDKIFDRYDFTFYSFLKKLAFVAESMSRMSGLFNALTGYSTLLQQLMIP